MRPGSTFLLAGGLLCGAAFVTGCAHRATDVDVLRARAAAAEGRISALETDTAVQRQKIEALTRLVADENAAIVSQNRRLRRYERAIPVQP